MRRTAAVVLGFAAGGIVAGAFKVFLLNPGPAVAGASNWFIVAWLAAAVSGMLAAVSGNLRHGFGITVLLALMTSLAIDGSPFRPPPVQRPQAYLVTAGACLIAGMVGGMIGRTLRRPAGRRPWPRDREDPD